MYTRDFRDWSATLNLGDNVIVWSPTGGEVLASVDDITLNDLVVQGMRFDRVTGKGREGYSKSRLKQPSPEMIESQQREELASYLHRVKYHQLSLQVLKQLRDLVELGLDEQLQVQNEEQSVRQRSRAPASGASTNTLDVA